MQGFNLLQGFIYSGPASSLGLNTEKQTFVALKKRNMNPGEIQQHVGGFESWKSAWLMLSAVNWTCWSVNDATKVKQRHFLMFFLEKQPLPWCFWTKPGTSDTRKKCLAASWTTLTTPSPHRGENNDWFSLLFEVNCLFKCRAEEPKETGFMCKHGASSGVISWSWPLWLTPCVTGERWGFTLDFATLINIFQMHS